jgi:hypothetical protein
VGWIVCDIAARRGAEWSGEDMEGTREKEGKREKGEGEGEC